MPYQFDDARRARPDRQALPAVPEWDAAAGDLYVRRLDSLESIRSLDRVAELTGDDATTSVTGDAAIVFGAELLAIALENEDRERIFDTEEGREFLRLSGSLVLQPIVDQVMRFNGLGQVAGGDGQDEEEKKSMP